MNAIIDLSSATVTWKFRTVGRRGRWMPAVVPGCVHRDLLHAGEIPDPFYGTNELGLRWIEEKDWEYRAEFDATAELLAAPQIDLVADGLDTVATVTLNGHVVARTENMFLAHRWPARRWLRTGRNVLHIRFASAARYVREQRPGHTGFENNDPIGNCSRIRKEQCQFGWDWGPRLVTAGIWRGLRLDVRPANRLEHVRVSQHHARGGAVTLRFTPELTRPDARVRYEGTLSLEGRLIGSIEDCAVKIKNPALWWPNGHGDQPLYIATLLARDERGNEVGRWERRLGLRTVALEQRADRWGESFQFVVNGRAIFAKGANWIPAHSFVAGLTRDDYARDLRAAAQAHMNMIRAWGGGIYESEDFYDLCDELGLLVWQDFMFSCALYPGDRKFQRSVAAEAAQEVRRLQHRACLALWCGNNEIYQLRAEQLRDPARQRAYREIFDGVLPAAIAAHDGITAYWPSSQWRGDPDPTHEAGERRGDTHFWDVWHARQPVKSYEKWRFRFCSEFGMQSYSSPQTNATFCPPDDRNVFGATMENHQKNPAGNQIILDYISRRYRLPKDQDALIYLSQLNQAYCMQTGVEHWRRHMPRCMGALYWQLNDCWPVASWSSIEFTGRWKALHHHARRFFAPALVSAHVPGDEIQGTGNYRRSEVGIVHLHTVYDAPSAASGLLSWELRHFDGRILSRGKKRVRLRGGESVRQRTLDFARELARQGRDNLYLRIHLAVSGSIGSQDSVFFAPPRFLNLPQGRPHVRVESTTRQAATLIFTSKMFLHRVNFSLGVTSEEASDNWFDLYPGVEKRVVVQLKRPVAAKGILSDLKVCSLADTYV
ncbi:beta-mannosidase [Nibricoccus aquaticus]|uniref:beta-mannosidase n=1 Tax=Nibricoccus aquaticus TaxID=2576891 RepID=UPI001586B24C|nr:glycoside hydrolase family 2 protein [Nibricoccus aquaticus]